MTMYEQIKKDLGGTILKAVYWTTIMDGTIDFTQKFEVEIVDTSDPKAKSNTKMILKF